MTDLEKFKAEPLPRTDTFCRGYRGTFAPVFGMVMWGILYSFFTPIVPVATFIGSAFVLKALVPSLPKLLPGWALTVLFAIAAISFLAAWLPFVELMRRWRGRANKLFRDGVLVEASFFEIKIQRTGHGVISRVWYRCFHEDTLVSASLVYPGELFDPELDTVMVLVHPELAFGLAFPQGQLTILGVGCLRRERVATGAML